MDIRIETISIDDVMKYNEIRYNTNNHWDDDIMPVDYKEATQQTKTSKWIDAFKTYKLVTIDLTSARASWMLQAFSIGKHTKKFPHTYDNELEMLEAYLNETSCEVIFDGKPYFIRTEDVSLKAGQHGVGPYTDIRSVLESLVTCVHDHLPIKPTSKSIKVYVIPWVELSG